MKKIITMILISVLICSNLAYAQIDNKNQIKKETNEDVKIIEDEKDFKVIAYCSDVFDDKIEDNIPFDKITHAIYAFLIPKEDGTLVPLKKEEDLKTLVELGHKNNVKVLIAIGGWFDESGVALDQRFEKLAANEESRNNLIKNIVMFVEKYNLDGVELDWEYPDLGKSMFNYEKLVLGLKEELAKRDKNLTAALNGAWSKDEGPSVSYAVSTKCLEAFDWISIMAYDMNNEDHSPFWFANTSIDYWLNRGVSKEDIVLGVPYYAHPTDKTWKVYRDIVKENKDNAYKDQAIIDEVTYYYNGIETIRKKTNLALNKAGGIMIFDVNEDTLDDTSLTKAINDEIKTFKEKNEQAVKNEVEKN
ncbi:glycosyl hydrolase family 18 protein [Peptostreptococcaceae bacterium AGR-M142]